MVDYETRSRFAARRTAWVAAVLTLGLLLTAGVWADDPKDATPKGAAAKEAEPKTAIPAEANPARLVTDQEQITGKYQRFEEILLRMAELTAPTDPKRAALLRKAVAESKQRQISGQMQQLVDALRDGKLATAVTEQEAVEQDLGKLLELLLTEQRGDKLKEERERLKEQIRKLKELINRQMQVQSQTEGSGNTQELADAERKLAEETGKLKEAMKPLGESKSAKPNDDKRADNKPGDSKPKDKQPNDKQGTDKKANDDKKSDGKPTDPKADKPNDDKKADAKPNDGKPSDGKPTDKNDSPPSDPKDGKPSKPAGKSQPSPMPPAEGDQPPDQNSPPPQQADANEPPGRKRVAAAEKKMEEARKKLEESKREGASKDQEEAVRQLEQARAELEEILRQLREEEMERVLAQLEARFRKMLKMQIEVHEGTQRLERVPAAERTRNDEIEAGRLGRRESLILVEIDKALVVLREDGSAVALPEAVEQMRDDVEQIVERLGQAKVDARTVGLEQDVIAALEELIAALKKAQRKLEDRKQQPPGKGGGQPQDQALVDKIAELKVIRALQMRVNQRTKRYEALLQDDIGQAQEPDLLDQLRRLAEQELRIYRTTRDIVVGKNQ